MNPMDEAEKELILDMFHKLSDEKVDKFLNYLKSLVSTDTANINPNKK